MVSILITAFGAGHKVKITYGAYSSTATGYVSSIVITKDKGVEFVISQEHGTKIGIQSQTIRDVQVIHDYNTLESKVRGMIPEGASKEWTEGYYTAIGAVISLLGVK